MSEARALARAIQLFRNDPTLKHANLVRNSHGYSMLCYAWENYVEVHPEDRMDSAQMKPRQESLNLAISSYNTDLSASEN